MEAVHKGAPIGYEFDDKPGNDDCYQQPDDLLSVFPDEGLDFFRYSHNFFLLSSLWMQDSCLYIRTDAKR